MFASTHLRRCDCGPESRVCRYTNTHKRLCIIAPSTDGICNNYEKVRAVRRTSL